MDVIAGAARDEPSLGHGPDLRLRLLDGFELVLGGVIVEMPMPTQKVLAFLSLSGRSLRREFVAGVLWSRCDQRRAAANLRSALWRLRKIPGVVKTSRTQVRLGTDVESDVVEMESVARRVLVVDGPSLPIDDALGADPETTALLDRDLLPDWYDEWVHHDRERLRQLRIGALERLSVHWRTTGSFALAVDAAMAAVRAEPLRECAHEALIEAYLAAGNRSEALRSYNDLRQLLACELGLSPSAEMQQKMVGAFGEQRVAQQWRTHKECDVCVHAARSGTPAISASFQVG